MDALTKEVVKCDRFIEKQFDEFIYEWPAEAEGLDATLAASPDFFAKLTRLETDGLPAHEQRFFELLESQSHQNLAALSTLERLSSQETENKRWRQAVLDVRQHMEFIGRETDESGVEVEVYRSGSGKPGGQRQKLATTCLAAALRYQLGGNEHGVPIYAPVVLDEAFDKADNEFTALAMNIFKNFGFQMIVATPLKSVMTLEPFIGGACFIEISDRRVSGVLIIEYDSELQRLKLPAHAHREASLEVS